MNHKIKVLLIVLLCSVSTTYALKVGDVAPDFTVTDPAGKKINLYSLKGKIILLDFWASWCGPCRIANKELVKIYREYKEKGVEIFSVSLDAEKEHWMKAIEKDKLTWPYHGSDLKEWESTPAQLYSIVALPTTFLIDEEGTIVAKSHDLVEIGLSLYELVYKNSRPFPSITSGKIYLPQKTKFEVLGPDKKPLLKGKEEIVDVTMLPEGNYTLQLENLAYDFKRIAAPATPVVPTIDSINHLISIPGNTTFQLYNLRGKLLEEGKGEKALNLKNYTPNTYYLNINGSIQRYYKRNDSL